MLFNFGLKALGGQNHDLLGFAVNRNDATKKCPEFPANRAPKKLNMAGLRLGLTKAEFSRIVATKIQWEGNIGRVFFESKRQWLPLKLIISHKTLR